MGRGGKAQERNLSSSDKKFIPFQTRLICNTSVTRGEFSQLCAPGAQTADIYPTPGATTRDVYGPTILPHASSNGHLQPVEKALCVFVFPVTGKWRKENIQSHCKGTSENAALCRDVVIRGKQLNSFLKAFFFLLKALLPPWQNVPLSVSG